MVIEKSPPLLTEEGVVMTETSTATLLGSPAAADGDTGLEVPLGEGRMVREDGWREAPAFPRRAAIEVGNRPAVGSGSKDGPQHSRGGGVAAVCARGSGRPLAGRARELSEEPGPRRAVLRADPVPRAAPEPALPRQLRDGEAVRAPVAHGGASRR